MNEQTQDGAINAFVEKLNAFAATLSEQEQGWLTALLLRESAGREVEGYSVAPPPPPFALTAISSAAGGAGGGKVKVQSFHITKVIDRASP